MSIYTRIYSAASDASGEINAGTSYATARLSTAATSTTFTATPIGQKFVSPNYYMCQYFGVFDTSTVAAGAGAATLSISQAGSGGSIVGDTLEVRQASAKTNLIAGDQLAAQTPLLGSLPVYAAVGVESRYNFSLADISGMTRSTACILLVHSQKQRLGTAPTASGEVANNMRTADATGTTNDPYLDIAPSTAWSLVGVGSLPTPGTTLTLVEPAGVADGDLLIACIASRSTATTAPTITGWTAVGSQNTNNTLSTGSAIASGAMLYRIRSGTPTLAVTIPSGISVVMGQIVAYRGNATTIPAPLTPVSNARGANTGTTYATIRNSTNATSVPIATAPAIGQGLFSGTYSAGQYFLTFDTSAVSASETAAQLSINVTSGGVGADVWEVREVSSTANMIAGDSLAALPLLGSITLPTTAGRFWIPLNISSMSRTTTTSLLLHSQEQRTATAPVGTDVGATLSTLAATADLQPAMVFIDGATSVTMAAGTAVSVAGLTTTQDDDLIVAMAAGGQEAAWSAFNATSPAGASGATNTTAAPSQGWTERADNVTTTGADTSLGIFDAVKTAAGATGNLTVTASVSAGHVVIAGAFKIATAAGGGVTVNAVGVSAGSSAGTVTVDTVASASFEAVGVAAGSAAGTVSVTTPVSVSFEAIGSAAAGVAGTATATGKTNISAAGQSAATAVGTVSIVGKANVTATGISAGTAVGTVSVAGKANVTATGQPATAVAGEVSVTAKTNISTLATGQAAVSVAGTVSVVAKANVSVEAVSVSAGAAVGTAGVSSSGAVSVSATSVAAPAVVGDVSIVGKANVTITGVAASALAGDPLVSGKAAVIATGVSAAAQTGVVSVSTTQVVTVTPAGQTTTALTGSTSVAVGGGVSITPASVAAAALADAAAVSAVQHVAVAATGQEATALAGSVSVSGGATVAVSSGTGTIAPPVYRPHTLTSYASRADTVMDKPATTAENDILIAALVRVASAPGAADVVPPAGFTKIGTTTSVADLGGTNGRLELFWKRATASEPATYTFGQWASATTQGLMVAYSGCPASGDPIDVFSQNSASTGSTATALSVTTTQAQDNLLWLGHNWDASTTLTPPSGMTEKADSLLYFSEETITAAGATGNRTQTQASSNPWAVTLLALKGASGTAAAATALTGTASVTTRQTAIVSATGVTAAAITGGVSVATGGSISLTPTSVTAAALTGTVAVTATQVVAVAAAGQAVTALAGNVLVSGSVSVLPAGQAVASDDGVATVTTTSAAVDVTVAAIGQAVQAEVGAVTVTTVALRGMDVWTGTAWVSKPAKVWTGSAWVPKPVKLWNGESWV